MTALSAARTAALVIRSPYLDPEAIKELQNRKLRRIVLHAWHYVPYYRRLFEESGLVPDDIRGTDDLSMLPVTTKRDLIDAGEDAFSRAYRPGQLTTKRTTGSTGRPSSLRFDRHFESVRQLVFLRALMSTGYMPGQRALVMKSGDAERSPRWTRWTNFRFDEPPARVGDRLLTIRPSTVYGWVTPMRELASYLRESGSRLRTPTRVITTAETLDPATRTLMNEVFQSGVFDFYGLTELGTVAWECHAHDGLHVSEDTVYVEVPAGTETGHAMIMTSLDLTSMPLIRYQTGDLAAGLETRQCRCGRNFVRLRRIAGRAVDHLLMPDGRTISPYSLTLALESLPGVARFQVLQETVDSIVVLYEGAPALEPQISDALADLVSRDMGIHVRHLTAIPIEPGRKFRIVESRLATK
jgi:phenylacetate-CoA ligase